MSAHYELGMSGEKIAVDYLIKNNYQILERNWRYKKAEIDIIALKKELLCIVEVKTRSTADFGNPQDFVKRKKIRLLVEAVNEYVIKNDLEVEVRFDIIAIISNDGQTNLEHLKDAFYYFDS